VHKVFTNSRIKIILIKGSILDSLNEGLCNLKLFKGNNNFFLRFLCYWSFVLAIRFIWIILTGDGRLNVVFNASKIWLKPIILFIICDTGKPFIIFVVQTSYSNLGPSSPNPSSFLLVVIPSKPPSRIGLPSEFWRDVLLPSLATADGSSSGCAMWRLLFGRLGTGDEGHDDVCGD